MDWSFPYPSQRMPVFAGNVVATSQPLAAQAGLDALRDGGNAVDAALCAAITLTVVEPTMNGIGSDAFALVWKDGVLSGLNASGRSPAGWTRERFAGLTELPELGWESVTVPGCVSAWVALSRKHGRLPFARLFEPAVHYAREGFHVTPVTAEVWARAHRRYRDFSEFQRTFCPAGRAPRPGELFRCPEQAGTLLEIAATEGESFYRGALAGRIAACAREAGAALDEEDLASHHPISAEPIGTEFCGVRLHEIPPNGQGLAALQALAILRHHDITRYDADDPECLHLQIEAMKLALADAYQWIADREAMRAVTWESLLEERYVEERAALIRPDECLRMVAGMPPSCDTVYLSAADADGTMVSFIQSNFHGFGSGIVIPGTGITMQNRGCGFSLNPGHPNEVGGGKRPFHTIIPGFVTRDGEPVMSFGVMGGPMQAQGHVQMMTRIFAHGQNPQTASDAPRWQVVEAGGVAVEDGLAGATVDKLRAKGHPVEVRPGARFGGAQLVLRLPDGGYAGASDHRKDGLAAGF